MDQLLSLLFCFLLVAAARSHATSPPELYWKSVLPSTPMPAAISDLLNTDTLADEKTGSTSVNVGKGGINVNTGNGKPGGTSVNVGKGGVNVNSGKATPSHTNVGTAKGGVHVSAGNGRHGGTNVNVKPGGVSVNVGPYGKKPPTSVHVGPYGGSPFDYHYAATETQLHDDPNVALFFMEKDLHAGAKMTVHFTKTTSGATFLPRKAADSIPFSSKKLPEILNRFAVKPGSLDAAAMKQTLNDCEQPAAAGEKKLCATSLESMVDFATSSLGTHHVQATSTVVGKAGTPKQEYTITGVRSMASGSELVACHAEAYAYAVFDCHLAQATRAYTLSMVGKDGTAVEAVAVCHANTAAWNPRHVAFQVLKVAPGTVPICHFLPEDHVVWTRSG